MSLNRFTFDFETFERVKLNSNFSFGLELNCENYVIY